MPAILEHLRSRREENLRQLAEYLRIPSVSTLNVGLAEAAAHLTGLMKAAGVEARVLSTQGHPAVYGEAKGPAGAPVLLVYGHYDVQPADEAEGWASPPFEPQVRDGRLWARGASDNKGQHFAQLKAVEAFRATGTPLPVTVKFLIEGEEEMGSTHLRGLALQHRDLLKADIACSSDGSLHPSRRPTLALGCRGLLYLELIARGAGKDLHSGSYGGAVESPFWRLMRAVQALREEDGRVRVPGFYDAVRPLGRADREALAGIPDPASELRAALGEGAARVGETALFYQRTLTEPNLNVCGFQGGYSGDGMKTVIPGAVRAKVDFRLVVDQDPHKLFGDVRAFLAREGFGDIEVRKLATFEPSKTPADHPLIQKVIRSIEWEGQKPVVYPNFGGSVPDTVFTKDLGLPSVWLPLSNADSNSHAPDENLRLDVFHMGCELAAQVMMGLGG